ncbi:hypothetical protein O6H91_02G126900 [Diphasiastrum complanatum]|nr:hypothetical protein O6H91_20G054900 [Diphasiastrum complanatum]KAJ7566982.1 hypothetical protein O6H91_02G126900 [Diphasiastrum complanatum]
MKFIQGKDRRKAMSSFDEKLRRMWYKTGEKMHLYFLYCILTCLLLFLCCHVVIPDQQQLSGQAFPDNVNVGVIPSQHVSLATKFQGMPQVDGGDRCLGRKIYMYTLPSRYNTNLLRNCEFGVVQWLNFCPHAANGGLGQSHDNVPAEMSIGEGWYSTDAYMLEVIFHSRMRQYSCLTTDTSMADAFFVPYYTGLDALYYLYPEGNLTNRLYSGNRSKQHGQDLIAWLEENARDLWKRHGGKDHFMVMGRTSWDFIKNGDGRGWGTGISYLPHISNMSTLLIEKRPWVENEQAVPYPTAFHPTSQQLQNWISKIKTSKRTYLLAYAGGIRPTMQDTSFRNRLLKQCLNSSSCITVDCGKLKCSHNPKPITNAFLQSNFCLQPRGDTPTRRSAFDAMIAGCIPVFFHEDSAYTQYTWHLPEDPHNYSVYISEDDVKPEGMRVEDLLRLYSKNKIVQLRDSIAQLIPRLLYSNRQFVTESGENPNPDAFDISILGILKKIGKLKLKISDE